MIFDLLAQAADAGGVDWTGIALVIGAIGSMIATVLGALGYTGKAKQAREATAQAVAIVHGVEAAENGGPEADKELVKTINEATGLELTVAQMQAMKKVYSKHVKATIKATAMEFNVGDALKSLVDKETTKRYDKDEFAERLAEDAPPPA